MALDKDLEKQLSMMEGNMHEENDKGKGISRAHVQITNLVFILMGLLI